MGVCPSGCFGYRLGFLDVSGVCKLSCPSSFDVVEAPNWSRSAVFSPKH